MKINQLRKQKIDPIFDNQTANYERQSKYKVHQDVGANLSKICRNSHQSGDGLLRLETAAKMFKIEFLSQQTRRLLMVPYLSMREVTTCLRTPNTCTSRLLRHNQLWCGDLTWQWWPRKARTRSSGRSEPQPWCSLRGRSY